MIKKEYMQPAMKVVKIQHSQMLCISDANAAGLGGDGLGYDKNGGNQGNAWSRGSNGWDDDED
jgi:hypothetical protein